MQPTEPTNPNDVSEPKVVPQSSESPEADIDLSIDDTSVEAVVEAPVAPESPEPAPVVSESPQPVAPPEIPVKKPKSKKLLAIAILVLVLAVAGALAWLLLGKKDDSSSSTDTAQRASAGAESHSVSTSSPTGRAWIRSSPRCAPRPSSPGATGAGQRPNGFNTARPSCAGAGAAASNIA